MVDLPDDSLDPSDDSKERALQVVRSRILRKRRIPAPLRGELAEGAEAFLELEWRARPRNTPFYDGRLGDYAYVIRNDDLDLVAVIAPAAAAIAGYATAASGANSVTLAVSLVLAMLAVARRVASQRARLDLTAYSLLMCLKLGGPQPPDALVGPLNAAKTGDTAWNTARVLAALRGLQQVCWQDGSLEPLVVASSDGRWTANGV